jgi:hypothetical protein
VVSSGGQLTARAGKGVKRGWLWRVLRAAACCRRALARWEGSRRSGSEGDKEGVRGVFFLFSSVSHGLGWGRGGWGSTEMESSAWLQGEGELEQRRPQ